MVMMRIMKLRGLLKRLTAEVMMIDYSEINDDDATEAGLEVLVQDLQVEDANEINYEEEEEDEEEIEDEKEKNKSSRYSRHKKNTPNIPFDLANY